MNTLSKTMWGIVLIAIGVIIGLNSLEITRINIFFEGFWTLFIIIPCFIGLFNEKEGKVGNVIGLIIGLALLCSARGFIPFEYIAKLIVPFILIMIGLSMIFKNTLQKSITEKMNHVKDGLENIVATFTEQKITKEDESFEGANLDAVFGGISLDISHAKLKEETMIKASSIFGGITIITPKDIEVKVKSTSIFGGVSNHTKHQKDSKKTIYIETFCLFGGVEIK
ncbi:MAG: cell wall-active antibiotics response protein [Bacilli bacterium]|nr:cell wall-active antibiotics response protein [Bacilli bacterium]